MPAPAPDLPPRTRFRRRGLELAILAGLVTVLLAPFVLRQRLPGLGTATPGPRTATTRRLVVVTPHPERLRAEFGRAFARYWQAKTGETVVVDWRVPGGTSEIAVMLKSEFSAAFEQHWTRALGREWTPAVARCFLDSRLSPETDAARRAFLDSDIGVGLDVFFGGGAYDFQLQAEAGTLVAAQGPHSGIAELRTRHPDWFGPQGIPETVSGEPFRDPQDRWVACCLSSFGIVYNRDVLARLGISGPPRQWSDLADPRYYGHIALADPGRSATVNKAFEMLIQQQMQQALARLQQQQMQTQAQGQASSMSPEALENEAVRQGWLSGLQLIQKISANARYYADSSSKIPLDVARGDAAAGMCIDYYGRTLEEVARSPAGDSRVGFVMPVGGSSVSVDPIAMFRGAPDPELATAFMEFVLSDSGQKLWAYRAGTPGGPVRGALRRLPARRAFYQPAHFPFMSDAGELPYEKAAAFTYRAPWTGPAFSTLRFLIRVMCVDTHVEQRRAWQALLAAGSPPEALAAFHDLGPVGYDQAMGRMTQVVRSRDKVEETRLARSLGDFFRSRYEAAEQKARSKQPGR